MLEKNKNTFRNIIWVLLLASIGSIVTIAYTYYTSDNRELLIANEDTVSLINSDLPAQITSNYFLIDKPNKKIKSFFVKKIAIKNSGNKGGENIPISVCLKGKEIFLINNPIIKTEPKEIIDVIKIKKQAGSTNNKHTWDISLLNPGESVIFEYFIYSEKEVKNCKANVLVRKRDWDVRKGTILDNTKKLLMQLKISKMIIFWLSISLIGLGLVVFIIFNNLDKKFQKIIKRIKLQ